MKVENKSLQREEASPVSAGVVAAEDLLEGSLGRRYLDVGAMQGGGKEEAVELALIPRV